MYEVVANLDEVTEAEWLALRKEGIGASEAAVAVGVSPWKSPMRLFLEKTGAIEPEVVDSEAVYWGQKLEASILSRFQELHPDAELRPTKALLRSKEFPFMLATPDSMGTYKGEKAVIEVKSTGHYGAAQWEGDEVPINYVLQGAHQLAVTGYALVIYPVLIAGQRYVERIIERDDSLIESLIEKELEFTENVKANIPPEWDGTSAGWDLLKTLYPRAEQGKVLNLPETLIDTIKEYEELDKKASDYESIVKDIRKESDRRKQIIVSAMGDAEVGLVGNYQVKYSTVERKEYVSKATTYRRFSLKTI